MSSFHLVQRFFTLVIIAYAAASLRPQRLPAGLGTFIGLAPVFSGMLGLWHRSKTG